MDEVDDLLADLARWTSTERADESARARVRERWLRQQAEEEAQLAGVMVDLAEAGCGVAVRLINGRTLQGRVAAVARDFCVLRHDAGTATLVAFRAVATVRPEAGRRAGTAAGERAAPLEATLADVLLGLCGERPRVRIGLEGSAEGLAGELRAVGSDVVTLRLDGDRGGGTVYVQLAAVLEVTLLG